VSVSSRPLKGKSPSNGVFAASAADDENFHDEVSV
jgi:hypothetical protein